MRQKTLQYCIEFETCDFLLKLLLEMFRTPAIHLKIFQHPMLGLHGRILQGRADYKWRPVTFFDL